MILAFASLSERDFGRIDVTMKSNMVRQNFSLLASVLILSASLSAATHSAGRWVGTWSASPEAQVNTTGMPGAAGTSFREIVHLSAGGTAIRVVLSNEFGVGPLTIGAAQIAIGAGGNAIDASTAKTLSFGGQASVTLPAGTKMVSDPVELTVPALTNVAVSLFIPPQALQRASVHPYALQTNYTAEGNVVGAKTMGAPAESGWYFLRGIEVLSDQNAASVVALGDSITDGAASDRNKNERWPDVLARRIQADKALSGVGVLNAGINGNRILRDGEGDEGALRRFDRDVLAQAGVKYLIVLEGINDIGHIVSATSDDPASSAEDLIRALKQIVTRAHTHGIKVIGATITPYEDCKYASPAGEAMRQAINAWIRTSKELDGVADFDRIVRDPAHPTRFLPAYDSGDHLHPNTAGLRAMAEGIDLNLLKQ